MTDRYRVPDPLEIIDAQIERQVERAADMDGLECARCEKRIPIEDAHPLGPSPAAPQICGDCLERIIGNSDSEEGRG